MKIRIHHERKHFHVSQQVLLPGVWAFTKMKGIHNKTESAEMSFELKFRDSHGLMLFSCYFFFLYSHCQVRSSTRLEKFKFFQFSHIILWNNNNNLKKYFMTFQLQYFHHTNLQNGSRETFAIRNDNKENWKQNKGFSCKKKREGTLRNEK